jgi:FkbM family methyltransferase
MQLSLNSEQAFSVAPMEIPPEIAQAVQIFVGEPRRRYLLGATNYAADIASVLPVRGIVDDRFAAADFHGIPVIRTADVPERAVVIATTLGRPVSARRHLRSHGITQADYFAFHRLCRQKLPQARFWTDFTAAVEQNPARLSRIRRRFCDRLSLETFDAIINFRLTANLDYLAGFKDRQSEQYFEDFLGLSRDAESFVDVGGFDGENTSDFISRCPGFAAVHIFEPDPQNIQRIIDKLPPDNRIRLHTHGLGDVAGSFRFNSSGSVSSFSDDGEIIVNVRPLDDCSVDGVSFLKMDIEGGELAALRGARKTIAKWQPRIAVCVYHQPDDFWTIPEEILSIHDDYRLYLRHYTEGVVETVMFFVPPESKQNHQYDFA